MLKILFTVLFVVVALISYTNAVDPTPPMPVYPYCTTMLRTHKFSNATFLSIYEEQCNVLKDTVMWEAINIQTGWPFSIRDADDTHVLGIRVIYAYNQITDPTSFQEWYLMTATNGTEYCVTNNATVPINPATVEYLGDDTIRGAPVEGWKSTDLTTGVNTTTWYTPDVGGKFPFRIVTENPKTPTPSEYGWVLDQGTHFVNVVEKDWFHVAPCGASGQSDKHPWSHLPWAKNMNNVKTRHAPHDLFSRFQVSENNYYYY